MAILFSGCTVSKPEDSTTEDTKATTEETISIEKPIITSEEVLEIAFHTYQNCTIDFHYEASSSRCKCVADTTMIRTSNYFDFPEINVSDNQIGCKHHMGGYKVFQKDGYHFLYSYPSELVDVISQSTYELGKNNIINDFLLQVKEEGVHYDAEQKSYICEHKEIVHEDDEANYMDLSWRAKICISQGVMTTFEFISSSSGTYSFTFRNIGTTNTPAPPDVTSALGLTDTDFKQMFADTLKNCTISIHVTTYSKTEGEFFGGDYYYLADHYFNYPTLYVYGQNNQCLVLFKDAGSMIYQNGAYYRYDSSLIQWVTSDKETYDTLRNSTIVHYIMNNYTFRYNSKNNTYEYHLGEKDDWNYVSSCISVKQGKIYEIEYSTNSEEYSISFSKIGTTPNPDVFIQ